MSFNSDKSEIVFFDVETTNPPRPGQGIGILEFGSILVCPRKLIELQHYSTLVRPADLSLISNLLRCNGITKDAVMSAPTFADIADHVYHILHGRIWAGHNILRFDCARIREAFAEINRPAPEPRGTIDSLALLTQRFGKRAGDMKMATLATYFGLGRQTHRSLDDVRMNLEVLKHCATVLFFESSLPDIFTENSWISPNITTRSRSNGKVSPDENKQPSSSSDVRNRVIVSPPVIGDVHPIFSLVSKNENGDVPTISGPFDMGLLSQQMVKDNNIPSEEDNTKRQEFSTESYVGCTSTDLLEPDEISRPSISAVLAPFYRGTQKIQILHNNIPLQACCTRLRLRFGISMKYLDSAGRPRLSFVVDAPPSLCQILDTADTHAQKLSIDSGSGSEWRPVVTRKPGFINFPTIRLNLPTVSDNNTVRWITDVYQTSSSLSSSSTIVEEIVFNNRNDVTELDSLLTPGKFVDAYFSLDTYDYQESAGIRIVAKKLVVHPNPN